MTSLSRWWSVALFVFGAHVAYGQTELITNGDFELGNTGFATDYFYRHHDPNNFPATHYDITNDPDNSHYMAASYGDHTSGTGLMMVVNGQEEPEENWTVWQQTVVVEPYTEYRLSAWVSTWLSGYYYAKLEFEINSQQVGTDFDAPTTSGVWEEFSATWVSGPSTTAVIRIVDKDTHSSGNDFAVDDISFVRIGSVPAVSEWGLVVMSLVVLTSGTLLYARRRPATA